MDRVSRALGGAAGRAACLMLVLATACRSTPEQPLAPDQPVPPEMTAEQHYNLGLEALKGRRVLLFFHDIDHPRAIEHFQEVIDNFPYSDYATLAELKIADAHFDQRQFEEAKSYYQDFVELHPNHPQVPYALYRNGLCSYRQMRDEERDQAPTREAVAQFRTLVERYPDSEPAQDARRLLRESEDRLATRELRIADFYYEQQNYLAALQRYRRALEAYPQHEGHLQTMSRIGLCLARLERSAEASAVMRQVLSRGVDGELRSELEQELGELAGHPVSSADLLPRTCRTDPNPACEPAQRSSAQ
jgi:outer membrane protein assembly factor BamD